MSGLYQNRPYGNLLSYIQDKSVAPAPERLLPENNAPIGSVFPPSTTEMSSVVGIDKKTGKEIRINQKDRLNGTFLIGKTSMGKSTLIENLVLQDIDNGLGVFMIDPHGQLVDNVLRRMKTRLEDVILIDLGSKEYVAPFNLFHCEDTNDFERIEDIVSAFMHVLESFYDISHKNPQMNQYFTNICQTLIYNPTCTLLDIPHLLVDATFRKHLVSNISKDNDTVIWFWEVFYEKHQRGVERDRSISFVTNKLDEFTKLAMKPWFGDTSMSLNFRQLMDQQKIVFIKLEAKWRSLSRLMANIFIAQLLDAAHSRSDILDEKDRRPVNIYIDEFQKFASLDLAELFTEARKYGIGLLVANQVRGMIEGTIKSTCDQAGNKFVFGVAPDDAAELANVFNCASRDEISRYEMGKEPVTDVLETMVKGGDYPHKATREFIKKYGKKLVEDAKKEEQLEQDHLHAKQRYRHEMDVYAENTSIKIYPVDTNLKVTHDKRLLLQQINEIFHQSMMSGKTGKNIDAINIPNIVAMFKTLTGMYSPVISSAYEPHAQKYGIQESDQKERIAYLQKQLTELSFRQDELIAFYHKKQIEREENIKVHLEELSNDRRNILSNYSIRSVIVKLGSNYYRAYKWENKKWENNKMDTDYWIKVGVESSFFDRLRQKNSHYGGVYYETSLENAIKEFAEGNLENLFFHWNELICPSLLEQHKIIEKTVFDIRSWEKKKAYVEVNYYVYRDDGNFYNNHMKNCSYIRKLDIFTFKPEIAKAWYTDEVKQAIDNRDKIEEVWTWLCRIWREQLQNWFDNGQKMLPDETRTLEKAIEISNQEITLFKKVIEIILDDIRWLINGNGWLSSILSIIPWFARRIKGKTKEKIIEIIENICLPEFMYFLRCLEEKINGKQNTTISDETMNKFIQIQGYELIINDPSRQHLYTQEVCRMAQAIVIFMENEAETKDANKMIFKRTVKILENKLGIKVKMDFYTEGEDKDKIKIIRSNTGFQVEIRFLHIEYYFDTRDFCKSRRVDTKSLQWQIERERERIKQEIHDELAIFEKITTGFEEEKNRYNNRLYDFEQEIRTIMQELADTPIEADNHTRIPVFTRIPSDDVKNNIANEIKNIDKYEAKIRTSEGEYDIQTIAPTKGMKNEELIQRIEEIQKQNVSDGYLRLRSEVEQEIRERRESRGKEQPTETQKPQPQNTPPASDDVPTPRTRKIKV